MTEMGACLRVVVFACNWEGYRRLEELGRTRPALGQSPVPTQVRVIRLPCLARLHAGLILKAFAAGADGVLALGCSPDRCHFGVGGEHATAVAEQAAELLRLLGIAAPRLAVDWVPEGSAAACAERIERFARGLVDNRGA